MAPYLFHQGTNYRAYEYMGCHAETIETESGNKRNVYVFRVWAPHATAVFVTGDFNGWSNSVPMKRITEGGLWEATLDANLFSESRIYKYKICSPKGEFLKADPYGYFTEVPPATASLVGALPAFAWHDAGWMESRKKMADGGFYRQPMNVYEVHLGSWRLREDGSFYTYAEIASELACYVKQMGYTHVELLPVMEHPFDGSWGYQVCGYYAPTSRYGTPEDFMHFVDIMHEAGIGVILDWVPAHFPKDAHGLYEFDGEPLYEYQGADRMEHKGWGTRCFDVARNEVQSFLISNATYWIDQYHIDGLRVDAVAAMLYLDYDRMPGEWIPNVYGDNKNLEAIAFFQKLNAHIRGAFPDVMMIAEESTSWSKLTHSDEGGLGFSLKWNMGWMNDILAYEEIDPLFKKYDHNKTTFSLTYCFGEKYVLPISHDEVVHGKKSLLDKMPGEYWQKFAGVRAFLAYMMTHPGKKLMFMGSEIGQFREWDYKGEVEWFLLEYEAHAKLQLFFAEMNHFYLEHPALWEDDGSWDGFRWINPDDSDRSILSYKRIGKSGEELIVVVNFTPVTYENYEIGVSQAGYYEEIINSDDERFGGKGIGNKEPLKAVKKRFREYSHTISVAVPPHGACIFRRKQKQKSFPVTRQ
ncbi:MAG: 1,4-alpha-glucan branching protein GlgB [Clostridia bacterium]|nr:1,4-alpha-glucan branching protein GlgB [Clostridia bacterium]